MKNIYQTKATASAGRNGNVETEDGKLSLLLSYPKEMGGTGEATNPEQLFAAGYSACFSNAILHVARETKLKLSQAPVTATIGIGAREEGGFALSAALDVTLDLDQEQAVELVKMAHHVCPYSNATRNNIDVALTVNGQVI
ncbi:organic hydroperoxide resistance protein [Shewanella eurypsychrophilus]|uniref:Organic hydroperoxide resistance protein n=1 Tax=Shewanella eurypsychrophilus TaxID=2593656 RepID=A0ABX6V883_9GAMM|nr:MULTISPECIES: organic hydroperoxide resistance protein [Shewanella]QFU23589.1 Ohr family peroxiredoxin [Shewanella sp. YLB-09]QPG58813.1 organic hydroperoxide resistance protein [Shewanella eurypsychrophilus]